MSDRFVKPTDLYGTDNRGQLRRWSIWQEFKNTIAIEHGVDGMQMQYESEIVNHGLAGRTQQEQIESRINSRINKKIDSGYVRDKKAALSSKKTNALGLEKPMLATRHDKIKNMAFDKNYIQYKYDGHRCLIKRQGDNIIAYSRNGKVIDSIDHITGEMHNRILDGVILDGELYCHGVPLQTIGSWVKKKQENTLRLSFVCYDMILDRCYSDRHFLLSHIPFERFNNSIQAPTSLLCGEFDIYPILSKARELGYEGLIVRPVGHPYETGKRSKGLIKVKAWMDDEYKVIGMTAGVDGQAILHMKHNGKVFKATAPGTFREKIETFRNLEDYIGKKVNVQYANLTNDGVPFHPVATMWRDKDVE